MAFRKPASPPDPDPELRPLADDPAYARLLPLRRALMDAQAERQRQLDIAAIESELRRPTGGSSRGPRADAMRARLDKLRAAQPASSPAPPADGDWAPEIAAGLRIVAGEQAAPAPDRAAMLTRLHGEMAVLDTSLRAVDVAMDAAKADASHTASLKLRDQHHAILRTIYDAAVALSAAVEAERRLVAGLIVACYDPRLDILVRPGLDGASRLGTLDQHDSQLNFFKRRLQDRGVI